MTAEPSGVRLRQAVLVAHELEPLAGRLRAELGLGEPYADPGVGMFGLSNAVMSLGDCFLEVVAPVADDTAAGRYLERRGEGGYMLIFQLEALDAARERVRELGIRVVWQLDLPDISGTHLHPADVGGAIVSLDCAEPPGSWRWAGPEWTERDGPRTPGRLAGAVVRVREPDAVAARWAHVLGVPADGARLALDGARVEFEAAQAPEDEGLSELVVALPDGVRRGRAEIEIGGVRFRLAEEET